MCVIKLCIQGIAYNSLTTLMCTQWEQEDTTLD